MPNLVPLLPSVDQAETERVQAGGRGVVEPDTRTPPKSPRPQPTREHRHPTPKTAAALAATPTTLSHTCFSRDRSAGCLRVVIR